MWKGLKGSGVYLNPYRSSSQAAPGPKAGSGAELDAGGAADAAGGKTRRLAAARDAAAHLGRSQQEDALEDVERAECDAQHQDDLHPEPGDGEVALVAPGEERDRQPHQHEDSEDDAPAQA